MINAQFLKTFNTLADNKSFIATAKKLNMTQPGVSQHLKHLESFYGVSLADRKGKFFQLTEAGKKLKLYCDKLFAEHDHFKTTIAADEPAAGECYIGCPGSFGLVLYSFLIGLNQKFPDLKFHFTVAPNSNVIQGVLDERYNMGFISAGYIDSSLSAKKISEERLLLVVPKKAKLKNLDDLVRIGFIAHPDGYQYAERLLAENFPKEFKSIKDFPLNGFINQVNRILDPVAAGLGFSVLPEYAVRAYPRQKDIQVVNLSRPVIDPISVIHRKGGILPKRHQLILSHLQQHLEKCI